MRSLRLISLSAVLNVLITPLFGQDVLFTQTGILPMHLNPALAGTEVKVRAAGAYRTQWKALGVPFSTSAMSVDMNTSSRETSSRRSRDASKGLGLGLGFLNDRGGDPEYITTQAHIAVAYKLQAGDNSWISLGMSGSFDQRSVDVSGGQWGSQYNGFHYDPSLASGEAFNADRVGIIHAGAGLAFGWMSDTDSRKGSPRRGFKAGLSAFQLGEAEIMSSPVLTYRFPARYMAHLEGYIDIGADGFGIDPVAYYVVQSPFSILLAGAWFRYAIIDASGFGSSARPLDAALGFFMRSTNAFALGARVSWGDYSIAMSYDMATGRITDRMPHLGAFEIALMWAMY